MTDVPESFEVIHQNASVLTAIYRKANKRGGGRHRRDLLDVLSWLAQDPERALRTSLVIGDQMCMPLRDHFNFNDPAAGIYLTSGNDDEEPDQAVMFVGEFLNHVLREELDDARTLFIELVLDGEDDIADFLGVLLAISLAR